MANSYRREGVVFLALKVIDWLRNTASSALVKVADGCRIGGAAHSITDKSKDTVQHAVADKMPNLRRSRSEKNDKKGQ